MTSREIVWIHLARMPPWIVSLLVAIVCCGDSMLILKVICPKSRSSSADCEEVEDVACCDRVRSPQCQWRECPSRQHPLYNGELTSSKARWILQTRGSHIWWIVFFLYTGTQMLCDQLYSYPPLQESLAWNYDISWTPMQSWLPRYCIVVCQSMHSDNRYHNENC